MSVHAHGQGGQEESSSATGGPGEDGEEEEAQWGASGGLSEPQGQGGPSPVLWRAFTEGGTQYRRRAGQGHRHLGFWLVLGLRLE